MGNPPYRRVFLFDLIHNLLTIEPSAQWWWLGSLNLSCGTLFHPKLSSLPPTQPPLHNCHIITITHCHPTITPRPHHHRHSPTPHHHYHPPSPHHHHHPPITTTSTTKPCHHNNAVATSPPPQHNCHLCHHPTITSPPSLPITTMTTLPPHHHHDDAIAMPPSHHRHISLYHKQNRWWSVNHLGMFFLSFFFFYAIYIINYKCIVII